MWKTRHLPITNELCYDHRPISICNYKSYLEKQDRVFTLDCIGLTKISATSTIYLDIFLEFVSNITICDIVKLYKKGLFCKVPERINASSQDLDNLYYEYHKYCMVDPNRTLIRIKNLITEIMPSQQIKLREMFKIKSAEKIIIFMKETGTYVDQYCIDNMYIYGNKHLIAHIKQNKIKPPIPTIDAHKKHIRCKTGCKNKIHIKTNITMTTQVMALAVCHIFLYQ